MSLNMNLLKDRLPQDNRPLHRTPFLLLWMGATAIGWFVVSLLIVIADDALSSSVDIPLALILTALFGAILSLVQGWAIRQRYGFIPRFWHTATILGMLGGSPLLHHLDNWQDLSIEYFACWFGIVSLAQMLVLWRVNRQAWFLMVIAGLATVSAGIVYYFGISNYIVDEFALLIGTLVYIVGTGIAMLRIMAYPREGSIPKRDNTKADFRPQHTLNPTPFMLLWISTFAISWVILFSAASVYYEIIDNAVYSIEDFLWDWRVHWLSLPLLGFLFGGVVAVGQKWLIERKSGRTFKRWLLMSTLAWGVAAFGFWGYVDAYGNTYSEFALLALWLGLPIVVQGILLWRQLRGGWVYALAGLVAGGLGVYIHIQANDASNYTLYGLIFGAIVQALLSGAAFIMLHAQSQTTPSAQPN